MDKSEGSKESIFDYRSGSDVERRLVRKLDRRLIPTLWVLYVLSYLDRANIGNARVGGMEKSLNLQGYQYSVALLTFFVSYILFEIPSNIILSRVRPSYYLSFLCFVWGIVAASMGAVRDWRQLTAVRFCLGVVEAGFAPGVAFYLSSWYKRTELAKRYCLFYTGTAVSGAFSGLLAGVITKNLAVARGIEGWRWLFIIEGVGSSAAAFLACYFLPDWPNSTRWLSEEERFIAGHRLLADGIDFSGSKTHSTFKDSIKTGFSDWRTWMLVAMFMLATGAQTIQYFIPALVTELGYAGYHAQYMTIPIYSTAFVGIVFFCFLSDFRHERGNYITISASIAVVSFVIVVSVDNAKTKYAFLCFAVGGIYAACPLTLLWVSWIIDHPAEKRAVAVALVNSLGNSASIYGSFLWPASSGPRYVQGFVVTSVFLLLLAILAQVNKFLLKAFPAKKMDLFSSA